MEYQSAIWMCQVIFFRYYNNMQSDNLGYIATSYRNAYVNKVIQKEHDCAKQIPSFDENILKQTFLGETGDIWHSALVPSKCNPSNHEITLIISLQQSQSVMKISFVQKRPKHCLICLKSLRISKLSRFLS